MPYSASDLQRKGKAILDEAERLGTATIYRGTKRFTLMLGDGTAVPQDTTESRVARIEGMMDDIMGRLQKIAVAPAQPQWGTASGGVHMPQNRVLTQDEEVQLAGLKATRAQVEYEIAQIDPEMVQDIELLEKGSQLVEEKKKLDALIEQLEG